MEIHRIARSAAAENGGARLERVKVAVGELSALEPELLVFAWEGLTSGTADAGSVLEVEWRPARQECAACGQAAARGSGTWLRICDGCGGLLRVDGGDELDVLSVTLETADEGEGSEEG
jgi:hydrogenase nickel incorporation protein HypA/HybF